MTKRLYLHAGHLVWAAIAWAAGGGCAFDPPHSLGLASTARNGDPTTEQPSSSQSPGAPDHGGMSPSEGAQADAGSPEGTTDARDASGRPEGPADAGLPQTLSKAPLSANANGTPVALPFTPANVDVANLPGTAGDVVVRGACLIDTDALTVSGTSSACADLLRLGASANAGKALASFVAPTLVITAGGELTFQGRRAPILIAHHLTVEGVIDVSSAANSRGAGADPQTCATLQQVGAAGTSAGPTLPTPGVGGGAGAGGGGGGSFGSVGGGGGSGGGSIVTGAITGGLAGGAAGAATSSIGKALPLQGGCPGGAGGVQFGNTAAPGGAGGGAIQLAADTLTIGGSVHAGGAGGQGGREQAGGGGGGSGGMIVLEGSKITLGATARISANGGGGGEGGSTSGGIGQVGRRGSSGAPASAGNSPAQGGSAGTMSGGDGGSGAAGVSLAQPGATGTGVAGGGGGGGGGGIIDLVPHTTDEDGSGCHLAPNAIVSPTPISGC